MSQNSKSMMRIPLIIAAAVVIIRIVLEQAGAPNSINSIFGVAWLYFLVPVYFAMQISQFDSPSPYKSLFGALGLYAIYTRLMVLPTYSLAWWLNWQAPRFQLQQGGVVGEGVSALQGLLVIPLRNAAIWIISAVIIGMIIGSVTLAIKRKTASAKA